MDRKELLKEKEEVCYKKLHTYDKYLDAIRSRGYEVCYIALKGSQNYNLEREESDYDAVAVVYPTLEVLVDCGPYYSYTYSLKDGSKLVVKDVNSFIHSMLKGSINSYELLTTPFSLGEEDFLYLLNQNMEIILKNSLMSFQKALKGIAWKVNLNFDNPGKEYIEEVATYGYRRKNLIALKRFLIQYKNLVNGVPYDEMYVCTEEEREKLLEYYYKPFPVEKAREESIKTLTELMDLIDRTKGEVIPEMDKINRNIRKVFVHYVSDKIYTKIKNETLDSVKNNKEEL